MLQTHIFISIPWKVDFGYFILHVYGNTSNVWKHILVVPKVSQEVHYGVPNLKEHWLSIPVAYQRTRIV